jgi:branched-chain amino acid transport system permease protein
MLCLSLAAIGLNVLTGYCGQISLGSGAFMAIGAYSAYKFGTGIGEIGLPPLPVLPSILLGGGAAAFVGILFGIPSLRIKGLYLAVATLAAQFFFDWVFLRVKWFTNYAPSGSVNAPPLDFFGWRASSPVEKYLVALAFVAVFALITKNLVRSNVGRQWMAIRDMDIAAEIMGIRPLYAKLSAFAYSSFLSGVAGALYAFIHLGSWEPLAFSIDTSFQLLFMVIIGGLGSILGSFLGAAFILNLPIVLDQMPHVMGIAIAAGFAIVGLLLALGRVAADKPLGVRLALVLLCLGGLYWTYLHFFAGPISVETVSHLTFIITGSLICYLLIVEPHGFARLWQLAKEKLRLWPFPY